MIKVTRLNGSEFYVNAELIQSVEETPDTVIRLTSEQNFVVQEKAEEIVSRIIAYKRSLFERHT